MKKIQQIQYFTTHKKSFDEVVKIRDSLLAEYENDSSDNLAKVVHNLLSDETADFYDVDFLNSALRQGLDRLPIAVAMCDGEQMIAQAKKQWDRFSWIQKLVLGKKPSDKAAATWLLASKFSRITPEFISSLSQFEQEVIRFIYGFLLYTANKR